MSASVPTAVAYGGKEPRAKQIEPMAKSSPIHQPMARHAHQVDPAEPTCGCLRCQRDSHDSDDPSGSRNASRVTNGPRPLPPERRQPRGTSM